MAASRTAHEWAQGPGWKPGVAIAPALESIRLQGVGPWRELSMDLLPGLNIITEVGWSVGRTTILGAICWALLPLSCHSTRLTTTIGFGAMGRIELVLRGGPIAADLDLLNFVAEQPGQPQSAAAQNLNILKRLLCASSPGRALLLDSDITGSMDALAYREAATLLSSARSQTIWVASRNVVPGEFPQARFFGCSKVTGPDGDEYAAMEVLQWGVE